MKMTGLLISREWNQKPDWFESLPSTMQEDLIALHNIEKYSEKQIKSKRFKYNKKKVEGDQIWRESL